MKLEQDRDGDGALDEAQVPLYDTRGNLVALTRGTDGTPVEKYAYSPFGEQRIFVDLTKPRIEQLRREGDRLLLEVSERIQLVAVLAAQASGELTLTHTGTGQAIEVEVTLPVLAGRTGAKRIAIRPTSAVEEGAPLRLHLAPGAVLDRFQNPLEQAYDRDFAWSALGEQVLEDTAPPQLDLVVVHENVLTVGFTEAIAAAQAETAVTVDGNPVTWASDEGGYTLHTEPLASGVHRIEIEATLADLAGTPLGESFTRTVELASTGALLYAKPDPREVSSSAASNPYGFQGLPKDPETGFVYARNRYYDPEMGRFVSADPLGYVDGPNIYAYAGNDPVNSSDPLGLAQEESKDIGNRIVDSLKQWWAESWLGQKAAAGVEAIEELAGGAREKAEQVASDDFGPTREMDPFLAELAHEAGMDPADLDKGAKLKSGLRETGVDVAGTLAENLTREASYAAIGALGGRIGSALGSPAARKGRTSRAGLGWAKAWHDRRATEIFGEGRGRRIERRTYDKSYKGRDIEFKSDNFARAPRSTEELKRMMRQLEQDTYNLRSGVASPAWHFEHDPRIAPEMTPVLEALDNAGIPWTVGSEVPY